MSEPGKLVFPTEFPIKVMGREGSDLRAITRRIVEKHTGPLREDQIRDRPSTAGKYLSVTFVIQAVSQNQLDDIYRELTASGVVLMAL
jgi:putative lipoic acid-binding regulatory protein